MAKKTKKKKKKSLVNVDNLKLISPPKKDQGVSGLLNMSEKEMQIRLERELRRYIKRSGGLRKGLEKNKKVITRVKDLCKSLKRDASDLDNIVWDQEIHVPGYDDPSVKGMFITD